MNPLYILPGLFILGTLSKLSGITPKDFYKYLNRFILYVPLPAIVLTKIPNLPISHEIIFPILSAWIIFFISILFSWMVCKIMHYDNKTMACIILCCGLGNTSFVGYPVLNAFYGEASIRHGLFVDQPGTFLILSTFGILIATYFGNGKTGLKQLFKKLFFFPPFLVFLVALFIPSSFITGNLFIILGFIGKLMIPLAMLSLGMQFNWKINETDWKKFFISVSFKIILAPFIIYILFVFILNKHGEIYTVSIIECAMPPMITSSIIATEYGLDEKLANVLPTLGIIFSIPTLLFWKWLLAFY